MALCALVVMACAAAQTHGKAPKEMVLIPGGTNSGGTASRRGVA
jgi:hypothetical protein